jgi:hypothetical protein
MRWVQSNYEEHPAVGSPSHLFKNCSPEGVVKFLKDFPRYPTATDADPKLLHEYIELCVKQGELTNWSIAFISTSEKDRKKASIEGFEITLQRRKGVDRNGDRRIKTLWSPSDEKLGLSNEEIKKALDAASAAGKTSPDGSNYRFGRSKTHGLLAIYFVETQTLFEDKDKKVGNLGEFSEFVYLPCFAISFPASESAPAIDYVVRNDFFGERDEDDEDNL